MSESVTRECLPPVVSRPAATGSNPQPKPALRGAWSCYTDSAKSTSLLDKGFLMDNDCMDTNSYTDPVGPSN
jgi:hypothetical protein